MSTPHDLPPLPLPAGITSSYIPTDDLTYHILEAGEPQKPLVVLLHGFPELAYSWRKVMGPLAAAGYYVVAFDQRGYGRTTGWDNRSYSELDLSTFSLSIVVADTVRLVNALGYKEVECVIGHDFGAVSATMCALTREDIFKSVIVVSHPFSGIPSFPFNTRSSPASSQSKPTDIHADLAALPNPRKHYRWYYSTPPANAEMTDPKSELQTFLRGYFYLKSADWAGNHPAPLKSWTADELAKLPSYYVMPLHSSMRTSVAQDMAHETPSAVQAKSSRWLPDSDLEIYTQEYARTSFQGGLNWYRVSTDQRYTRDVQLFAGKKITVPALFVAGKSDWGAYQVPGAMERQSEWCEKFRGSKLVDGAGHWVQQEQPKAFVQLVLDFLGGEDR